MEISLASGEKLNFGAPVTVAEIAARSSDRALKNAVCGEVDGKTVDLSFVVEKDASVKLLTIKDEDALCVYRRSCALVLAQAVKSIYPTCLIAASKPTETGFYCDVEFKNPISKEDFSVIESEMQKIIKSDLPIERFELKKKEAAKLMKGFHESYKVALIESFPSDTSVSFYKQGAFTDMCKGPHLPSTGKIKAFTLSSLAGAYWRGNENNKMLTRIYGVAFAKKSQLDGYLKKVEEAKKREHNKLGRELGLFDTDENVGQGLPLLLPKGALIMRSIVRFVENEELKRGILPVKSPEITKISLYSESSLPAKRDKLFSISARNKAESCILRPSGCPFHFAVYKNGIKSYRDLPCRYGETATVFRNEASGEIHGLTRIRQFTLSEGHSVILPKQAESEFEMSLDLSLKILGALGLDENVGYRLFTRGEIADSAKKSYKGGDEEWLSAESAMRRVIEKRNLRVIEEEGLAPACGPCFEIVYKNVFGKADRLLSFQFDFGAAREYKMFYFDENCEKRQPWVLHRSAIGCYERIVALLIEKYSGAFPLWLAPVQVAVLAVADRHARVCESVKERLSDYGYRVVSDLRSEKIGKKVRDAQLQKIPYMLIIGDDEGDGSVVSVRKRVGSRERMEIDEFLQILAKECAQKN